MNGRPHAERLESNLSEIREELTKEVLELRTEDLGWAPREGMKTYQAILQEVGTMEQLCTRWLAKTEMLSWPEVDGSLAAAATDPASLMRAMDVIRAETLQYLRDSTEESLETPVDVAPDWRQYMGLALEPEEFIRWIGRHEYYHLGQIVSYRFIQGADPTAHA